MKTLSTILFAVLVAATAVAGDEPWFDLENCAFCQHLTADMDLFQHMTWETKETINGMIEVTTYPVEMKDRYDAFMKKMEATGQKMMAGEPLHTCGMCASYGGMMMAGAQMEMFEFEGGSLSLTTSSDPAVIAVIHKHAQTTITEYAKWMEAEAHGHAH